MSGGWHKTFGRAAEIEREESEEELTAVAGGEKIPASLSLVPRCKDDSDRVRFLVENASLPSVRLHEEELRKFGSVTVTRSGIV